MDYPYCEKVNLPMRMLHDMPKNLENFELTNGELKLSLHFERGDPFTLV
jgi:hypothetical protein